jgi:hypothetical protein
MWTDPIIEELHQIRQQYAARFNFDLDAIAHDLQRQQAEGAHPVVSFAQPSSPLNSSSAIKEQEPTLME